MSRTINQEHANEQKDRIVDAAVKLFNKKGYEKTSLNEIIDRSKIAKGTFYHYFHAKEEMIDYIVERMYSEMLPAVEKITANPKLGALSKFNKVMRSIKRYKVFHRHEVIILAKEIYKPENIVLKNKLIIYNREKFLPVFTKIIKQGKEEKVFTIGNPEDTAEVLFHMGLAVGDSIAPMLFQGKLSLAKIKLFVRKAKAFREAMQRVLGMNKGSLDIYDKNTLEKIIQ